jgi:hypothetical protein
VHSTGFAQVLRKISLAISLGNKETQNKFEKFALKKTLR